MIGCGSRTALSAPTSASATDMPKSALGASFTVTGYPIVTFTSADISWVSAMPTATRFRPS
ncbi:MAG: hypothetical protein EBX15_04695 [Acidimicrobiia bacterium]|nr:hypothetical protein [Acidimicrobiia bacterium]